MGGSSVSDDFSWESQRPTAQEEKIFVSVRVRPLNDKERVKNEVSDWECINNSTIISKNNLHEQRSLYPAAYTFDRVFGTDCATQQVYEEGAKNVALSVLSGINSSIFAYGQTSSGKTYTMNGITRHAISDIYDYMERHTDREFLLKFSAMEIYNESVRDLLSDDTTPLRLLDDPERGTVVEKLTEVCVEDEGYLRDLLDYCESQRQVGETSLNETSSRSHQILRLTVDSSAREFIGADNSSVLSATVNFVDLAGSERASQTSAVGTRLREGSNINRSLLTLGTVIRKLSKGRGGHIPFRDSKLTRILQNYLGGNARTAIICTMSPAHCHVDQSRNTLLFAMCAKDINTNAQVNVVMSEKALVKQLQKELARLENELKSAGSKISATAESTTLLKEKEVLIQKMDKEIRDLTVQRDIAQSRLMNILQSPAESQTSTPRTGPIRSPEPQEYKIQESAEVVDSPMLGEAFKTTRGSGRYNSNENSEEQFLSDGISPRLFMNEYFGPDPCQGWEKATTQKTNEENSEDNCKEVRCIEEQQQFKDSNNALNDTISPPSPRKGHKGVGRIRKEPYEALKQKIQDIQTTIDGLASPYSSDTEVSESKCGKIYRSRSCREMMTPRSPSSEKMEESANSSPLNEVERDFPPRPRQTKAYEFSPGSSHGSSRAKGSGVSVRSFSMDEKELNRVISSLDEASRFKSEDVVQEALRKSNATMAERTSNAVEADRASNYNRSSNAVGADRMSNATADDEYEDAKEKVEEEPQWAVEFEKQRREIIELWDACNIPLVHRTYFFLLFKGDPSDSVYLEVELRRLAFLKQSMASGTSVGRDGQAITSASSLRDLNKERDMLSRQMYKTYTARERDALYVTWGIKLESKQRRIQLSRKLWTDTNDMEHIKASACIVAKLAGIVNQGEAPKEMFGLSFFSPRPSRAYNWKPSISSLRYS